MTTYAGSCQDLGFLCEWQVTAATKEAVVASLVDHVNHDHGTGSSSPALVSLVARHVAELPPQTSKTTHVQERAS